MLIFNLELEALDLEHDSVETTNYLTTLFSTVFESKYDKLDKKVLGWFDNYADAFFNESGLPGYYNLHIKRTTGSYKDVEQYINELPLEFNHIFIGKIYETPIEFYDNGKSTELGKVTFVGIAEKAIESEKSTDIVQCILYMIVQMKE